MKCFSSFTFWVIWAVHLTAASSEGCHNLCHISWWQRHAFVFLLLLFLYSAVNVKWTCACHVNHCYGDFVWMTWNFFCATVWLKSSSTRNLSTFGSVVLGRHANGRQIFQTNPTNMTNLLFHFIIFHKIQNFAKCQGRGKGGPKILFDFLAFQIVLEIDKKKFENFPSPKFWQRSTDTFGCLT